MTYSDKTTKVVNLSSSMLSEADLSRLSEPGTHELTISYEDCSTKITVIILDNRYSVTVVYPDGTPVTGGVSVQWCTGNICLLPVVVNANGVAYNDCDDDEYYVHIEGIPTGYTYDPNAYTTNAANKNITIKLIQLSTYTGTGTAVDPIVVSNSAYIVNYTALSTSGVKYYSFTAPESKEYTIRSICQDKLAINEVDPYIGFLGTANDMANADVSGNNPLVKNFSHTFTAIAGTTYYFVIMISAATNSTNADCTIVIE